MAMVTAQAEQLDPETAGLHPQPWKRKFRVFIRCDHCWAAEFTDMDTWARHYMGCPPPPRYGMEELRAGVLERDGYRCQRCGRAGNEHSLQVHHITPLGENGPNERWNLITVCRRCHAEIQPEVAPLILRMKKQEAIELLQTTINPAGGSFHAF
jgi:hypothetical protein